MSGEAACPRCGAPTAPVCELYVAALEALSAPRRELSGPLRTLLGAEADLRGWLRVRSPSRKNSS